MTDFTQALESTATEIKSLLAAQSAQIQKHGETTASTAAAIEKADAQYLEIKQALAELEKKAARPGFAQQAERKSLGHAFVESAEFKGVSQSNPNSGQFEMKDITGGSASAGALVPEFRNPNVFANPDRPLHIRQLVNNAPCAGDAVVIMREKDFTNNAGPQNGQLTLKPKSDVTFETLTLPVQTMAHHFVASRQILADAPRLAAMINQRSVYGLNLNMDAQLLYGDGQDGNLTGLMTTAGLNTVGQLAAGTTGDAIARAMLDHLRKAVTKCQMSEFYNVNGVVINPQDWELLELAKGSDGQYIWVNVNNGGQERLWRVPVITSNAIAKGDFIMGDWSMGATLYQREGITVRTSESHADLFVKNGVVVLAEERAAFGVELPKAFTKGSFTVA